MNMDVLNILINLKQQKTIVKNHLRKLMYVKKNITMK
jgi:hypothetical protein